MTVRMRSVLIWWLWLARHHQGATSFLRLLLTAAMVRVHRTGRPPGPSMQELKCSMIAVYNRSIMLPTVRWTWVRPFEVAHGRSLTKFRSCFSGFIPPVIALSADADAARELLPRNFSGSWQSFGLVLRMPCGAARYAPTNERGIVGSMLDYRNMFDVMVATDGGLERVGIRGITVQLNESPMSVLGMESAVILVREMGGHARTTVH